jgi:archaeosine-15-forming tRNA-guanine transglycosylase
MEVVGMKKNWEVIIEQITGKPNTRVTVEMTTKELVKALEELAEDHIIAVRNLTVPYEERPVVFKEVGGRVALRKVGK